MTNLNTDAEKIEILKAVIEKRDVFYYRFVGGKSTRQKFEGTVPDFRLYRYEVNTTQVRSRVEFSESPMFPGTASGAFYFADKSSRAIPPGKFDVLEAWYENGTLNLRPLTKARVVLVPSGLQEGQPSRANINPLDDDEGDFHNDNVTYAYKPESRVDAVHKIAGALRDKLRANRHNFRTAQLCQTTGRVFRFSNSELLNNHRYHAIFVLKDVVLVSRFGLKPEELSKIKLEVGTRIRGAEVTIGGHIFNVHWK